MWTSGEKIEYNIRYESQGKTKKNQRRFAKLTVRGIITGGVVADSRVVLALWGNAVIDFYKSSWRAGIDPSTGGHEYLSDEGKKIREWMVALYEKDNSWAKRFFRLSRGRGGPNSIFGTAPQRSSHVPVVENEKFAFSGVTIDSLRGRIRPERWWKGGYISGGCEFSVQPNRKVHASNSGLNKKGMERVLRHVQTWRRIPPAVAVGDAARRLVKYMQFAANFARITAGLVA